jgi:hypothetical protein
MLRRRLAFTSPLQEHLALILVGTADRSAARNPCRQALRRQAEAAVLVARQEVAAAAEVAVPVPASQQEVAAAEVVPASQREVAAAEVVPASQREVAAEAVPASQQEVAAAAVVPASQREVVAAEVVPASQREVAAEAVPASQQAVAAEAVPASQQEVAAVVAVPVAQQEAASPVAPREAVLASSVAVSGPRAVLTEMAVQAAPSVPARVPAVAGQVMGSLRCRAMAAVLASAPQSMAAVAARGRWGLAMDPGRPSSRPARARPASGSLSAAAAADLQSHRAAAARFACPGWVPPLRPAAQQRVAMAVVLASAP